ncbi:MAG: cache domain-containing protein [Methanoregula sp.]|nr:cache domain-containing protein [Methanoregula sp.]
MIRNHTKREMYSLVDDVVNYAKANGKQKTLDEINNPDGQFVHGDLTVWASSANGTMLADPYLKDLLGKNFLDYTDSYGDLTTQDELESMNGGTGFTHAMFPYAPANSSFPVPKLVYTKAVDGDWWIGSGIYGVEVK